MKNMVAKIRKFLEPDKRKIALFALLAAIMTLGAVQSVIVSQREAGIPDTGYYWLADSLDFETALLCLTSPIIPVLFFASLAYGGIGRLAQQEGVFIAINVAYFYVLSCSVVSVCSQMLSKWKEFKFFIRPNVLKFLLFAVLSLLVFAGTDSNVCDYGCTYTVHGRLTEPVGYFEGSYTQGLMYLFTLPVLIAYSTLMALPSLFLPESPMSPLFEVEHLLGLATYFIGFGIYLYFISCLTARIWEQRQKTKNITAFLFFIALLLTAPAAVPILAESSKEYYGYERHKSLQLFQKCPFIEEAEALVNACPSSEMEGTMEEMEELKSSTIDDQCLTDAALKMWDRNICDWVVDKTARESCRVAVKDKWNKTPKDSKEYQEKLAKYRCFYDVALELGTIEACMGLPDESLVKECETEVMARNLLVSQNKGGR